MSDTWPGACAMFGLALPFAAIVCLWWWQTKQDRRKRDNDLGL